MTNKKFDSNYLHNLGKDLPAGLVVFLVAVPLCLGIALASGAPLFSGIIAGIVGGIVVTSISGSPLGVSGPAAGLAVIVLVAIQDLGSFDVFLMAVVLAGIIQMGLGFLKAGIIGYYFPNSVIKGMLSGIGIIIILKQIPHAFGYDKDPEGDFSFQQVDGQNTFSELFNMMEFVSPGALIIAVSALAILILWEQKFMKRIKLFNIVQGPLVVVILGIILNISFIADPEYALNPDQVVNIPVADSFLGFFSLFTLPDFSALGKIDVYTVGFTIAIVASLETLLCVEATDKLDPHKRITPTNRELVAQGAGNIVSGLIGGLPVTQVIVRSSANIQSGGQTRASAFFHGILLLFCAMLIPNILNMVPLASLAAILFVVGYKLAKPSLFKEMFAKGHSHWVPFLVTILGIVFTDLLIGIGLGLAVAILEMLWMNFKVPFHFDEDEYEPGKPVRIELAEEVSFLNKASILDMLSHVPDDCTIIIDAHRTTSMHDDVREIFEDFKIQASERNIDLQLIGLGKKKIKNQVKNLKNIINKNADLSAPTPLRAVANNKMKQELNKK